MHSFCLKIIGAIFLFPLILFGTLWSQKSAAELISSIPPPAIRENVQLNDGARRVKLLQNYLLITNFWGGLQVIDISDIRQPQESQFIRFNDEVYSIFTEGNYLYLANDTRGIQVFDITNPGNLQKLARIQTPGNAYGVHAEYPFLFVAMGNQGFSIMNISDLQNPITQALEMPGDWVNYLYKEGNVLYIAAKKSGLLIYDISNPERPRKLAQFRTDFNTMMMQIEGGMAYIADGEGGLLIMNVSNPAFPVEVARFKVEGFINQVNKIGNYVYLANREIGLQIVNVSNPLKPFLEGVYSTESNCYGVVKRDIYVFLAANTATLVMRHNNSPRLEDVPDLSLKEGQVFSLQLKAVEPDGDPIGYAVENLPEGSSLNETSGLFTWTPTFAQAGSYTGVIFSVVENTESGLRDADTVSITVEHVNRLPDLTAVADTTIFENQTLAFMIPEGSDPDPEDQNRLTYRVENLPEGAVFDPATRNFSWTPTFDQSGIYVIDFLLDDGAGGIDREPATITVNHVDRPPVIAAVSDQTVNEGDTLKIEITGEEPDKEDQGKIFFTVERLPKGADFDPATRLLTWIPTYDQSGIYENITAVMRAGALGDTARFSIEVQHVNRPPVLAEIGNQQVDENQTLSFKISGSDPDQEDTGRLQYSAANLPPGAVFNADSLQFSWTPAFDQSGDYDEITFTVADPAGLSDAKSLSITVRHVNRPPLISQIADVRIPENDEITVQLQASDPDPEDEGKLIFSADNLPSGATLDPATGLFRWTPGYEQSGTYQITALVSDGQYADSAFFNVNVEHVNRPPQLSLLSGQTANENEPLNFEVKASDPDKEDEGNLQVYARNLPEGAAFDSTTGQFKWVPDFEQSGNYEIIYGVRDPQGLTDEKTFSITVQHINRSPVLEAILPQTGEENQPLLFQLTGSDPDQEDAGQLRYEILNLPEGAVLDPATGHFSWTPGFEQSGQYELQALVRDPGGLTGNQNIPVEIKHVNRPPEIKPVADQTVNENATLNLMIEGSDPDREDDGQLTYYTSTLPEGAQFDAASQTFTWTPNYEQSGEYQVTFGVRDPAGASGEQPARIIVRHTNRPPVLETVAPQVVDEGQTLRFQLNGSDPDKEDAGTLQFEITNLPQGATLDPGTGQFSWTPDFNQAGKYELQAMVEDKGGLTGGQTVEVVVNNINQAPRFSTAGSQSGEVGQPLQFKLQANDPDQDELRFEAKNLPQGADFNNRSGEFEWTPAPGQEGAYTLDFTVTDSGGLADEIRVALTIHPVTTTQESEDQPQD